MYVSYNDTFSVVNTTHLPIFTGVLSLRLHMKDRTSSGGTGSTYRCMVRFWKWFLFITH